LHVGLHHVIGLLGLLHRRSRVVRSLQSHGCDGLRSWLLCHFERTNAADERARATLRMSGASRSQNSEKAETLCMPHMIPCVGFEQPLWLPLWLLAVIKCIYILPTYLHFMQDIEDRCLLLMSFVNLPFQEHRIMEKHHMDHNPCISSICQK
jgi:hypothetical protein